MIKQQDLPNEIWRKITFDEASDSVLYFISNMGRIKSPKGIIRGSKINGYNSLNLKIKGKAVCLYIHRLVAKYFIENADLDKSMVIHLNWDKEDNRSCNLQWVNKDYAYRRACSSPNRTVCAERSPAAKLSEKQVAAIKECLNNSNVTKVSLARKYKISTTQIRRISKGDNWKEY